MEKSIGTVKWFDNAKGYGFIVNEAGEDVFVHYRSIEGEGYKTLAEGQQVQYVQTKSDKGWQAAEVSRLEDSHEDNHQHNQEQGQSQEHDQEE